jgi:hypothetical protein
MWTALNVKEAGSRINALSEADSTTAGSFSLGNIAISCILDIATPAFSSPDKLW